jgi:hypothetical protein
MAGTGLDLECGRECGKFVFSLHRRMLYLVSNAQQLRFPRRSVACGAELFRFKKSNLLETFVSHVIIV